LQGKRPPAWWLVWAWLLTAVLAVVLPACSAAEMALPVAGDTTETRGTGETGNSGRAAGNEVSAEAARIASQATWASGQLQAHFQKHGREGPHATAAAYDASARDTIRTGRAFRYVDRESRARRRGFYDPAQNRFTAVTEDGRRITTHFRPDSGERYVRGLQASTYTSPPR
jgi:pyocin large subunit-like protein